jgi:hypothetical protein
MYHATICILMITSILVEVYMHVPYSIHIVVWYMHIDLNKNVSDHYVTYRCMVHVNRPQQECS